jgi:hypothetical protein
MVEFRCFPIEVLTKGRIDQGLIPGRAPGLLRHFKKAIHNVLIQPDRDAGFCPQTLVLEEEPAALALAEVVLVFHFPREPHGLLYAYNVHTQSEVFGVASRRACRVPQLLTLVTECWRGLSRIAATTYKNVGCQSK